MSGGMGGGEGGVAEDLLTTKGDTHGYSTENARVAIGSNTQVLTADSTEALGLKWATPTDIAPPTTTKGDLSGFSTSQASIPVSVTNGQVLTTDSTEALGLKWATAAATSPPRIWSFSTIFEAASRTNTQVTAGGATTTDNQALGLYVTTAGDAVRNYINNMPVGTNPSWSQDYNVSTTIYPWTTGTDFDFYAGLGYCTVTAANIDYTKNHLGWKSTRVGSGTIAYEGTIGDNTTETAGSVTTLDTLCNLVKTSTSVKFYDNSTLRQTLTTNLPINVVGGDNVFNSGLTARNVATASRFQIYSWTYEASYA